MPDLAPAWKIYRTSSENLILLLGVLGFTLVPLPRFITFLVLSHLPLFFLFLYTIFYIMYVMLDSIFHQISHCLGLFEFILIIRNLPSLLGITQHMKTLWIHILWFFKLFRALPLRASWESWLHLWTHIHRSWEWDWISAWLICIFFFALVGSWLY